MYVQPTSTVYLLRGVPITDYKNQILFDSVNEQSMYFTRRVNTALDRNGEKRYSYVRPGVISVPYSSDELYNCTYLSYQNTEFSDKYFYAFVRKVEYVNANTSRIIFEMDEYQTWMFDIDIKQCYVLREHHATDVLNSNLIDEGLSVGEYLTNSIIEFSLSDCWICVCSSVDLTSHSFIPVAGAMIDGVYTGLAIYTYDDVATLENTVFELGESGKSDAISGMYMLPKSLAPFNQSNNERLKNATSISPINVPKPLHLDGYIPKNAKTLSYPYAALVIGSTGGTSNIIKLEYFLGNLTLELKSSVASTGSAVMYPMNYKGVLHNVFEGVTSGSYAQCQWIKDNYLNFIAMQDIRSSYAGNQIGIDYNSSQKANSVNYNLANANNIQHSLGGVADSLSGAAMGGGKSALGGVASGALSAGIGYSFNSNINDNNYAASGQINAINYNTSFDALRNTLASDRDVHALVPPTANGGISSSPLIAAKMAKFYVQTKTVNREYAKAIDDFFTMYGYKVNELKTPELNTRDFWNYIQTSEANIIGELPKDSLDVIKTMFNSGVTLWHQAENFLDYSNDNSVFREFAKVQFTVENGSGSGSYAKGTMVTVQAYTKPDMVFETWLISGGNPIVTDYKAITTTVLVTDDSSVSAHYVGTTPDYYGVTVSGGSGSGSYKTGQNVIVNVVDVVGNTFKEWTVTGLTQPVYTTPRVEFRMPSNNVSFIANWETPVDPSYDTIADVMASLMPAKEWDEQVGKIQRWYYGSYVKAHWCATCVSYCAYLAGVTSQVPKNEGVDQMFNALKPQSRKWFTANYGGTNRMPVVGDLVGFSSGYNPKDLTHVGCVSKVEGTKITYISGNTSNRIDYVTKDITNLDVVVFFHVVY